MVYRHFGDAHAAQRARLLRKISTDRGLVFMIGQDWRLALEIDADGVHMPERDLSQILELHTQNPTLRFSLACHNLATLRKAEALDGALSAVFVSPVFVSASASARGVEPLGVKGLRAFTEASPLPVYALGGINCDTIGKLRDAGLSGVAAIDAFRLED